MPDPHERREIQPIPEWQAAEATLGLEWRRQYIPRPDVAGCRIISDPVDQRHEVWLAGGAARDPETYRVDIMHELCHAKISEAVDPAFSTMYFKREYGALTGEDQQRFNHQARLANLAWLHTDVWVNDLRHQHWPELTEEDVKTLYKSIRDLIKYGDTTKLHNPETMIGIALSMAETRRHKLTPKKMSEQEITRAMGPSRMPTINQLAKLYANLPRLTFNRDVDLANLGTSVQQVARILQLPITPHIIEEEGRAVWELS